MPPRRRPHAPDGVEQHRNWLSLVEVSGPFLSLPVLRTAWPTLDALEKPVRERLRAAHATWLDDQRAGQRPWLRFVLTELLGWGDALRTDGLARLTVRVAEHETELVPSFALVEPGSAAPAAGTGATAAADPPAADPGPDDRGDEVKPDDVRLLGLVCEPGQHPTARVPGSTWAASPADRLAQLCRHHEVELGLVTDGRWWTLVWAPRGGVTSTAVFDAVGWPESAERDVVRAFVSLLCRRRFFGVAENDRLVPLLRRSLDSQEDITEALGVRVRQAVELLVAALGRVDVREREAGRAGLAEVDAHEVYRGAVSVMMRVVFLLFAEERGLLPADNELYASAYSAGGLCAELERRANEGSEEDLEHTTAAWHRLLALFDAVYRGVAHPRLRLPGHKGSLFDPAQFRWLPLAVDDRTVLHMLQAVQYVEVGSGRSRERRRVSFGSLDVEQIGYVYEGLLSFEGFRADEVTVGLVGREGLEEEVRLLELERLRESTRGPAELAAALAERFRDSRVGSAAALSRRLAPLPAEQREEARKRLLAVTGGDYPLAERLLPFVNVIRADLRGLPVVILPGALYVTESALRRNTGTHYTPRELAEQVVAGALEPLVYRVGPRQTTDRDRWVPRSSAEILSLKVADIAMGSAAFLVAAARFLAEHLIGAWSREGDERARAYRELPPDRRADPERDPLVVEARRQVIEHCLYGVDINPMAVEMAKLSLWLVSMDPERPFTFLDDRLATGDSLLGVTSLAQLEYLHLDPRAGRQLHEDLFGWADGVRPLVAEVAADRRRIAEVDEHADPHAALAEKERLYGAAEARTDRLRLFADLLVGATLAGNRKGARQAGADGSLRGRDAHLLEAARLTKEVAETGDDAEARRQARRWLATDQVPGTFDRAPLHWPLVFPEVFDRPADPGRDGAADGLTDDPAGDPTGGRADRPGAAGFDAVIGNPPFLGGQKLTGSLGTAYREHLVAAVGRGARGSADLVAYFALRAHELLNAGGQTGLIATNTLAQGDTREVGLDQLVADGVTIRQAVKSRRWPSRSASLEYCAVWTSRAPLGETAGRTADGVPVPGITSALDPVSRVSGTPQRLAANAGISFIGSYILGMGFTVEPDRAAELIARDARNREVLFPYLNGQDLNSRPDCSASRWVINFHDWDEERARSYPECYEQVRRLVKPERDRNKYSKTAREHWWLFERSRPELYAAIAELERVVVLTRVSKTVMPVLVPTGQVISEAVVVFATDHPGMLAVLSSAPHYWWARNRASSMRTDLRYTPSDVFETFPLPELTPELRAAGERLDSHRREVMLRRRAGLTATYNLVFDESCRDEDIAELRAIHRAVDEATCQAYGWGDLRDRGLAHGFHVVAGQETRYTVGPAVARELVDRLLEENQRRYQREVDAGRHDRASGGAGSSRSRKGGGVQRVPTQQGLFEPDQLTG